MKRSSIVLSLLAAGCASTVPVPDSLKPGANESLALIVPAKGVQIYECRAGSWAFVAPEAHLFDRAGKKIGSHYAGPHWEAADGSKVVATVRARADAPAAGNIPWLLLGTKSVGAEGAFSKVTSIQRVATVGGVAPAGGCSQPGARARVAYSADYYLFTAR
jgi:FtsP/CotA-like multicopper oxidase with cupredoxin domain